ncbi:MAG TPA: hypothetical protein VEK79_20465 [Thermoanaerobaculia bacterium]|nr:hypothetical protein [Thermoanaerobaculia bacterium]
MNSATLILWMFGLMTHIGDDTIGGLDVKEGVALVSDQHHLPFMGIIDRIDTTPRFRLHEFKQGDEVIFEDGVEAGGASASAAFQSFTPTLGEPITNSLLDEPIKEMRPHDDVVAWIHYPQGDLDIIGLKTYEGKFSRRGDFVRSQCVPASTVFKTTATQNVVTMYVKRGDRSRVPFDLEGLTLIIIINEPSLRNTLHTPDVSLHFTNYGRLLERRYGIVPRNIASVMDGNPCARPEALSPNTTLGMLLPQVLPQVQQLTQGVDVQSGLRHAVAPASLDVLLRIFVAEHSSCTNTDWP